tara:strand:+ start:670 stop:1335 length:666 start_codon:yes stop_codon:yes gene_type:complete
MGYFRELPNVEYESPFSDRVSNSTYVLTKNIFKRMKIRDDLQNIFTIFDKYEIAQGARPDTVAEELYGSSNLDWVVIISSGIININDEWPMSEQALYEYTVNKYGSVENIYKEHHKETIEVKNTDGIVVLPKGKKVDSQFTFSYYDNTLSNEVIKTNAQITESISNYGYEVIKNNKKRTIYVLRPSYLQQFLNDMREEMTYSKSSQRIDSKTIRTENTRIQ